MSAVWPTPSKAPFLSHCLVSLNHALLAPKVTSTSTLPLVTHQVPCVRHLGLSKVPRLPTFSANSDQTRAALSPLPSHPGQSAPSGRSHASRSTAPPLPLGSQGTGLQGDLDQPVEKEQRPSGAVQTAPSAAVCAAGQGKSQSPRKGGRESGREETVRSGSTKSVCCGAREPASWAVRTSSLWPHFLRKSCSWCVTCSLSCLCSQAWNTCSCLSCRGHSPSRTWGQACGSCAGAAAWMRGSGSEGGLREGVMA